MANTSILLSIKNVFAEKILDGEKLFELRKVLPREEFSRVYLYVSGGQGVVGCFDRDQMIRANIDDLWEMVGKKSTTKDRFYKYFDNREVGCAIKVKNPVRLKKNVFPDELKELEKKFVAPQSFLYLRGDSEILRTLEISRQESLMNKSNLSLHAIESKNVDTYVQLITKEISNKYPEITKKFAERAIRVTHENVDLDGIYTLQKEVLEVRYKDKLVGFTTLTHKMGHGTKTGPSVIIERYRNKGYGNELRFLIENWCRAKNRGRLYCTCPDNDHKLHKIFLQAGYKIEGHLAAHYRPNGGDLSFGKVLKHRVSPAKQYRRLSTDVFHYREYRPSEVKWFNNLYYSSASHYWGLGSHTKDNRRLNLMPNEKALANRYEEKAVAGITLLNGHKKSGLALLATKRGGSLKFSILSSSKNIKSIKELINHIETLAFNIKRRKVYTIVPSNDSFIVETLRSLNYLNECSLLSPYSPDVDGFIYSKFL